MTVHRAAAVLTRAAAALGVLTLVLAFVLSFTYVPSGAQAWDDPTLGGGTAWTAWHRWTAVLWIFTTGASAIALAILTATSDARRRAAIALGGTVVAGLAAVVVLGTSALVQWDQLALSAVTVGDGLDGYWPVFDDGVLFVLLGGAEVDPGDYGTALAVHLLAHVVGVAAAVGAFVVLVARRGRVIIDDPGHAGGIGNEPATTTGRSALT